MNEKEKLIEDLLRLALNCHENAVEWKRQAASAEGAEDAYRASVCRLRESGLVDPKDCLGKSE